MRFALYLIGFIVRLNNNSENGNVKIDISMGELVDRVTILSIKREKIKESRKLRNVEKEYSLLSKQMNKIGIDEHSIEFKQLKEVNLKLWQTEDAIRVKERRQEFDDEFIRLARSVYFQNDERAAIKREISIRYDSELIEEKEYVNYKNQGEHEDPTRPA